LAERLAFDYPQLHPKTARAARRDDAQIVGRTMRGGFLKVLTDRLLFWSFVLIAVIAIAAQIGGGVSPPPG
jgi:hypothetical protein